MLFKALQKTQKTAGSGGGVSCKGLVFSDSGSLAQVASLFLCGVELSSCVKFRKYVSSMNGKPRCGINVAKPPSLVASR